MEIELEDFITKYEELRMKYGLTNEFRKCEKEYASDIEFLKFKKKNRLWYDEKKNKWNKEFRSIVKTVWIKDKKNWNKELRKYGYFENYTAGWEMGPISAKKCMFCGKLLTNKQTKFCAVPSHKKRFHEFLKIAKEKFGFSLDNGMIFIPSLFNFEIDKSGEWYEFRNKKERIESKDVTISINGKSFPLTRKSRTILQ